MDKTSERPNGSTGPSAASVEHLSQHQLRRLSEAFELWHRRASSSYIRRVRGRYWLSYLFLRFTGARIGEVLRLNDLADIDFDRNEVRILRSEYRNLRNVLRTVPVPPLVTRQVLDYRDEFPGMRGRVFALDQGNFRREFYRRAQEADLPRDLSHPHILRHTRAVEMLRAGVPLTTVQELMGHVLSGTTALYLQRTEITVRKVLEDKGLL
ncbi:MAG TPA: site-specific integrase [Syntrophobacteraceae bacterium]|nr:site-specific integrase [Syntrophobacteraceae bacterium]